MWNQLDSLHPFADEVEGHLRLVGLVKIESFHEIGAAEVDAELKMEDGVEIISRIQVREEAGGGAVERMNTKRNRG